MDGLEALARLRATPGLQKVPVIIMTGADSQSEALEADADDCLYKPLNLNEVFRSLITKPIYGH